MIGAAVYLDFEYYNSKERRMDVVCCAAGVHVNGTKEYHTFWLHDSEEGRKAFGEFLAKYAGATFYSYNVIAEARAFSSLCINPLQFKWVDLMLEWKQLRNGNYKRLYGRYIDGDGNKKMSYPPPVDDMGKPIPKTKIPKHLRQNNSHTGTGLISCVYNLLEVDINASHKDAMRDRILKGGPFNQEDAKKIIDYCASDIKYLPAIARIMQSEIMKLSNNTDPDLYLRRAYVKGEWAARLALVEEEGIPVNVEWLKNIGKNFNSIRDGLISVLVSEVYPFYAYDKKKKSWVEKRDLFAKFVTDKGLADSWPKTPVGAFSTSKETLEDNEDIIEIKEYRRVREALGQIRVFREADKFVDVVPHDGDEDDSPVTEGKENIFERIGSDSRLRCYFNPYGTQTSRNAPAARNFILAMSAWLRSCIQPPEGYAITGVDYSSEEFLIAACEAKDKAMEAAYDSGDVYIWLAKVAGAVPKDATKKSHPRERDEYKAVCLGMQYSLGVKKLHRKLTHDTGIDKGLDHARELAGVHRDTFSAYWTFNETTVSLYSDRVPLRTRDGWFLFPDLANPRSAGNFPIQGAGGAILRRAIRYAQNMGLHVISPLHDAIYIVHKEEDTEAPKKLQEAMNQAFIDFYGRPIRMEAKTWTHSQIFIEGKGKRYYNRLKEFMTNPGDLLWMEELQ
jgi:DNA polymerase I